MEGEGAQQQKQPQSPQQPRPTLESDGTAQGTTPTFVGATPTPFIYPIRSLLGTVQPAPAQPKSNIVDPSVYSELAASLQRELAAKRAAHPGQGEPGTSGTPASSTVASAVPGTQRQQPSGATTVTTATFPSTFNLPNRVSEYVRLSSTQDGTVTPSPAPPAPPTQLKTWDAATGEEGTDADTEAEPKGSSSNSKRPLGVTIEESTSDLSSESVSSLVRLPPAPTVKEFDEDVTHQASQTNEPSTRTLSQHQQPSGKEYQGPPVTVRLKYQQDENGHHHVVGREGTLTKCEDEPIRAPGAVQSYGVIIVLEEDIIEGRLIVRQVSENVHRILGLSIPFLFSLECFSDIFSYEQAEVLWKHITFLEDLNLPDDDEEPLPSQSASQRLAGDVTPPRPARVLTGPEVFNISGQGEPTSPDDSTPRAKWRCWVAAHRPIVPKGPRGQGHPSEPPTSFSAMKAEGDAEDESAASSELAQIPSSDPANDYPRLVVLEFELENDDENPLYSREVFQLNRGSGTAGSRTSASEDPSARGESSGGKPSTGTPTTSSATTTTPMPGDGQSTNVDGLPPSAPLTNAALHALDDAMARAQESEGQTPIPNIPPAGQVFSALDSPDDRVVSASSVSDFLGTPVDEDINQRGLSGDQTWYPSIDDIHESTTSRSKPIKALEKMRMMARGFDGSPRRSPAFRRLAGGASSAGSGSSRNRASPSGMQPGESGSDGSRMSGDTPSDWFRSRGGFARPSGNVGTMDVFAVLAEVIEQLGEAADLDTFLKSCVGVMKDLTQFHRVLIYQFDEAWNGQVVAELVDWSASHDLFMGLHFPASDIPPQARELYVINKVRSLYDREQPTSRLVCRDWSDLEHPLDMTHCYLRAMSPIHVKYLKNMGVRASMSISITAFGKLWGLIACHSYGLSGMRVSFPVRQMLRLLSDSISRNIERLSYAQRLHTRKLISTIPTDHHPTGYIVSNAEDLLSLFSADYGILVIGEGAKILGPNNIGRELLIVAQYLRMKQFALIQASQSIARDFPDLMVPSLDVLSGLLYVPLSPGGRDFVCFFRKGQMKDVIWAGKPHKPGEEATASLEPRTSFKAWAQTVMGRCRSWTDEQLETAGVLALIYGKFIEVWRQKENAVKSTQLASLLLTNASHEVRTPLNQIIGFLELALESNLDDETRNNLAHAHTASKSLLFTINDLLDLTRLESGHLTQFNDTFDLIALISESCAPYVKDAHRKSLTFDIVTSGCPQWVMGDSRKLASVISNLVANAVKYTAEGGVTVEAKPFQEPEGLRDRETTETTKAVAIEIIVADTGCGIPNHTLEDIFRQFEQVERPEDKISLETPMPSDKPSGLGLGLAVVARIVEQAGGQLRVDSGPGGSRFSFLLPFTLPEHKGHRAFTSLVSSRPGSHTSGTSEVEDFVSAISASHMGQSDNRESQPASVQRREPVAVQSGEGVFPVQDSRTGVRGVKLDSFFLDRAAVETRESAALEENEAPAIETAEVVQAATEEEHEGPEVIEQEEEGSSRPPGQLRVLVVEDDKINSTLMQKRLTKWNHIAVPVMNGQEAKDTIESDFDFDCIMMDLQMPILDGYQATSAIRSFEEQAKPRLRLKSHRLNGRIPIFAVSASLTEDQRADLWELGLDGWLLKPIMWGRFQDLLEGVTSLDQRRKDIYQTDSWEKGGWLGWYEGNGPQ
ncbi:Light-sensor Protein kinase [Tulasnella sp. 427]|nr:Light-sensor Protein kinase [Tulasnella sp. 427]